MRARISPALPSQKVTMRRLFSNVAWICVAALVLASCGRAGVEPRETPSPSPTKTIEATPSPSASPSPTVRVIAVIVRSGKVETAQSLVEVAIGSRIRIEVTADVEDEVHVHAYDLKTRTKPGETAVIEFVADIPGTFEVELEERKLELFNLTVR
jgi:hypothetical protein